MAIVKMKKLTLLAMNADKESIFDALVKTKAVELKRSADIDACTSPNVSADRETVLERIARVENSIGYVSEQTEKFNAANKRVKSVQPVKLPKNGFSRPLTEVGYDYFLSFGANAARIEQSLDNVSKLREQLSDIASALTQKETETARLNLVKNLPHPTTWYRDTESSTVQLMQCNASEIENAKELAARFEAVDLEVVDTVGSVVLVVVVAHKSQTEFWNNVAPLGLIKCGVVCDILPQAAIEDLQRQILGLKEQRKTVLNQLVSYASEIAEWKIYVDYLSLCEKKLSAEGDLQKTDSTFVLEAYYPAEDEVKVKSAVENISDCAILAFDEIGEDEYAPTLIKNNKITKQFEFVTNMYTPPAYHEIDPNPVMSVFYFVIFGLMVADIGYGALLVLAGLFAFFAIKQTSGLKTMLQLFGICGVSAMIVGALFGSCFSYQLYEGVIPNPANYPMVMMLLSLLIGIVHICAGIACNMAVKIKRKQALAAWLADFPWIIVFVGFVLAIFNSALDMAAYEPYNALKLPPIVGQVGLYCCLGALALALLFAGLGTKGFLGKVMKSFGSAYGIINYFSDIMSYIRVFGLMLSSALMGTVINQLGEMVWTGGGIGYVMAIVLLVFAHIFNLVMGILGIYIHNGRLQYVEFFGKFYTGDGHLFVPFGSDTKYTLVTEKPSRVGKQRG